MASSSKLPHTDIELVRDGAGDRAIVFLHGFLDDNEVWNPVVAELGAHRFETVQFDLAGFGARTGASGPFTHDRYASDLTAVVDAIGKPFVLVGHSMATPVIELVAASRPTRTLGLVLISPNPIAGMNLPAEFVDMFRSMGDMGPDEHEGVRQQMAPSLPDAERKRIASVAAAVRPEVARTVVDMFNNGYPAEYGHVEFRGPVSVIRGTHDPLITADLVASNVAPRFNPAKTTVTDIEMSAHWPHMEHPSDVASVIARFLADLPN